MRTWFPRCFLTTQPFYANLIVTGFENLFDQPVFNIHQQVVKKCIYLNRHTHTRARTCTDICSYAYENNNNGNNIDKYIYIF
jgi:hypothetical protein